MGCMKVIPEITNDVLPSTVLFLPGADTWMIQGTDECGVTVAAICGATIALAESGVFDVYIHTSNSLDNLNVVCPNYKGE
ncbi:hypothetical protein [Gracilibacillus kekensis]|uniref:hypothetical protein n=1 Tax=Gracilibacillus kekensis TaxID=1027249 RepID=UPI0009325DA6|nr:hypothetical protein [Gracilibacillus kekensis]